MKKSNRSGVFWFLLLMVFSVLVRAYRLDFPTYHWDEIYDFNNAFYASFNHLALSSYVHGSFHAYLILIIWKVYLLLIGVLPNTNNLISNFFENPVPLLLLARGWVVIVSTGTVAAVFLLGKRLYNKRVGWLSAILLAGNFLHTAESHYARAHILAAFLTVLVIYFCRQIFDRGNQIDYTLAGISLGLAVASQYSVAFLILPILYAHYRCIYKSHLAKTPADYLLNRSILICLNVAAITLFFRNPIRNT